MDTAFSFPVRSMLAGLVLVPPLALAGPTPAEGQCGLDVQPVGGTLAYMKRQGNRCEGLFVELQSAPRHLRVVSLTKGHAPDLETEPLLVIRVPDLSPPGSDSLQATITVLAQPLDPAVNWALDGRAAGADSILWNLDEVFHRLEGPLPRVGIAGRTARKRGLADPVYVPAEITAPGSGSAGDSIHLVIHLPAAGEARVCVEEETHWCSDILQPLAGGGFYDGYFEARLPPGEGLVPIVVLWRESGSMDGGRDRFDIYRW